MDLVKAASLEAHRQHARRPHCHALDFVALDKRVRDDRVAVPDAGPFRTEEVEIGRASCRERVC